MSSTKGAKRRPAAGHAPDDAWFETSEFANLRDRRRKKNKLAKASRKKNRR